MKRHTRNSIVSIALLVIAAGSGLLDYFTPMTGDDLMFWKALGLHGYTAPDRSTVSFILAHIFGCNGRLFDYMGPIITNLPPRWLSSVLMGAMAGVFFFSVLFVARVPSRRHTAFSLALLAVTLAVMPWWDSMYLRVCQFNYPWAAAFCLLFIGFFFRNASAPQGRLRLWALLFLGICVGASHEQSGVAMCAAFFWWCMIGKRYRRLSLRRKYMLAGLLAGTVLSAGAPSIWARASAAAPGQSFGLLVATTLPVLMVLMLVCAVMLATVGGRRYLKRRLAGAWGVLAVCAVVSGAIAVASGVPGRTGFLPESCSIVALAIMALDLHVRVIRPVAAVVSAVSMLWIVAHFSAAIAEQRRVGHEFDDVLEAYVASPDGIVYYDITGRYDVSPLALNRVKGVPDADDYWARHSISEAYGTPEKIFAVLPSCFRGGLEAMADSVVHGATAVYASRPDGCVLTEDDVLLRSYPGPAPQAVYSARMADGREIWIATPRVRDPGDYELPVKTRL